MGKFIKTLTHLLILLSLGYFVFVSLRPQVLIYLRLSPESVGLSGTGSMYPTFPKGVGTNDKLLAQQTVGTPAMFPYPKGIVLFGRRYLGYSLGAGDIVAIENKFTDDTSLKQYGRSSGFIKRIVGLPGDTLELRDGLVYKNGQIISEPYIAKPRSTFGNDLFPECQPVRVPANHYFVMGDNRTASSDSRYELGFVLESDINHVLPIANQTGIYDKYWRDTTKDTDPSSAIHLDKIQYLSLVNSKRKSPLKYDSRLEKTSQIAGYTTSGTITLSGHYTSDELFENQLEFPKSLAFLTNQDYQALGISETPTNINNCPGQKIVIRLAGYVPPNYSPTVIASWVAALNNLKQVQPSWKSVSSGDFYAKNKPVIDRINELLVLRIDHVSQIVARMQKNQWLTPQEKSWADEDVKLSQEQFDLSNQLKN